MLGRISNTLYCRSKSESQDAECDRIGSHRTELDLRIWFKQGTVNEKVIFTERDRKRSEEMCVCVTSKCGQNISVPCLACLCMNFGDVVLALIRLVNDEYVFLQLKQTRQKREANHLL